MSENWQVDIARSESDRKRGYVEVAAYTSISFDRRTVAVVKHLEDARQIVADHTAALSSQAPSDEVERLREALRFYADPALYRGEWWPIRDDQGWHARLALVASGREDEIVRAGLDAQLR